MMQSTVQNVYSRIQKIDRRKKLAALALGLTEPNCGPWAPTFKI